MRAIIKEQWIAFTEPLEGGVASLYNDIRGLTTIAYGNLVNAPSEVVGLPFVHPDGRRATFIEITSAWHAVHNDPICAAKGWTYAAKLPANEIRLTRDGMRDLALKKLGSNDFALSLRLPNWEALNACAQMAMHSLAWACGSGAHFPRLFSALDAFDYDAASIEIQINEWTVGPTGNRIHNSGLVPRNIANKILMRNAARVESYRLDPNHLNWKQVLDVTNVLPQINTPIMDPAPETELVGTTIHPMPDMLEAYLDSLKKDE